MKSQLSLMLLMLLASSAQAATVSCPPENQLAGTYETIAAKGFTPNKLILTRLADGKYKTQLSSYWAPKPFDNGELGTIGDFHGGLYVPMPWSCTAFLYVEETDLAEGEQGAVCVLALRFIDLKSIYVNGMGKCDNFHGHNAYPDGQYILNGSK